MRPYSTEWLPQASLPIAPPIVARVSDEGSGANVSLPADARSTCARSSPRMTPASTQTVFESKSISSTAVMRREKSTTMPSPTALPAIEVPPPRVVTGCQVSAAACSSSRSSSMVRGNATRVGRTR